MKIRKLLTGALSLLLVLSMLVSCGGGDGEGTGTTAAGGTTVDGTTAGGTTVGGIGGTGGNTDDGSTTTDASADGSTTAGDGGTDPELDAAAIAAAVIEVFGHTPEPWSFLPEAFGMEGLTVAGTLPTYADFTPVSSIPRHYIGKQMNVVYGLLDKCDTALGYINQVQGALNVIQGAYQAFINDNPEGYSRFAGEAGGFSYELLTTKETYRLSAKLGSVEVMLASDLADKSYSARVQLTDSTVLKYEVKENHLKIAMNILNSAAVQIEFVRAGEVTEGYLYEFLTVAGKELVATGAYLRSDADYTTVVGTKGDFIPTADARNCEVYDSKTGRLVGTEVSETLGEGKKSYDTLWYALSELDGITSVKKLDEQNVLNPDTVWINGRSDSLHTKTVSLLDLSRRFDIEFKEVCAYTYDASEEAYTAVTFEIPMLFLQEGMAGDFAKDFSDKNGVSVTLSVSERDREAVAEGYHTLVNVYNKIKDAVTQADIAAWCTQK